MSKDENHKKYVYTFRIYDEQRKKVDDLIKLNPHLNRAKIFRSALEEWLDRYDGKKIKLTCLERLSEDV